MLKSGASQRRPWVVGNWKMNGGLVDNEALLSSLLTLFEGHGDQPIAHCSVAVPTPYLFQAAVRLRGRPMSWGAQDVSSEPAGAFTGEVSVAMLQDFEAEFCLVGHSERRGRHGETDRQVAQKAVALAEAGLTPVICVGESLDIRDRGQAVGVVCDQVRDVAQQLAELEKLASAVFAYEPIWAIGATEAMNSHQVHEMSLYIQKCVKEMYGTMVMMPRIIYGGAVNADNAREIVDRGYVDGLLVGRESLKVENFVGIIKNVDLGIK
jgi:triosephosphate isomerase